MPTSGAAHQLDGFVKAFGLFNALLALQVLAQECAIDVLAASES
jgi:hypothetical protein